MKFNQVKSCLWCLSAFKAETYIEKIFQITKGNLKIFARTALIKII